VVKENDGAREREVEEEERDVTMTRTAVETKMGAARCNNSSIPVQQRQVLHVDHGSTGHWSWTESSCRDFVRAAGSERSSWNQLLSV
jgi:hypothetical protein